MLYKHNKKLQVRDEAERHPRFSIRKLSAGAASVVIGIIFI